ncbi:MAG: hypothetical protein R3B81_05020 [bacterium]
MEGTTNWITVTMVAVMLGIFAAYLVGRKGQEREGGSLLTSIGIFGTFLGVSIALFRFQGADETAIKNSVPVLLAGMRVAFFSSVVGLALSILLRVKVNLRREQGALTGATADDIHAVLTEQTDLLRTSSKQIERALVGEGDTTLLSQLRLLRQEVGDNTRELRNEFRTFSERMAEDSSRTLIQALEEVIRDFNTKLTTQFGENFRQLNEAVGKLLEWQDRYRQHIEETEVRLASATDSLSKAERSFQDLSGKSQAFVAAAEALQSLLVGYATSEKMLAEQLSAFGSLSERAQAAMPRIEENLVRLTEGFRDEVVSIQHLMKSEMESLNKAYGEIVTKALENAEGLSRSAAHANEEIRASTQQLATTTTTAMADLAAASGKTIRDFGRQTSELLEETRASQAQILEGAADDLKRLSRENRERTQQQIEQFDLLLGEELTKSLESLGSQLASLSARFVQDYRPLTEELRRVVQIASGLK